MVDKGTEIREKAKQLVELLGNNEAIRAERYKARILKARAVGMGNDNGSAGGFGSGGSSISPNDHALLSSSPSTVVQSVISTFGTSTHLSVSSVASLKTSVDEFRAQVFPHSEVEKKVRLLNAFGKEHRHKCRYPMSISVLLHKSGPLL